MLFQVSRPEISPEKMNKMSFESANRRGVNSKVSCGYNFLHGYFNIEAIFAWHVISDIPVVVFSV
jgi:hypothetical protein